MSRKETLKQSVLASYAVMKALTDSNDYRDSYEILADFIRYLIADRSLHQFTITEVSNALQTDFGFDNIPLPVIKTSLRKISGCTKNGDNYTVSPKAPLGASIFQSVKQVSIEQSQSIIRQLMNYATTQHPEGVWLDSLEDAFIKYLLDDTATIDPKYADIISKFIVINDGNEEFKSKIAQIREGSILYCGLAYNISEIGSITNELTLYLDTEVLFNIAGYNGELYQKLALDFLNQVKNANAKQKKIKLSFFREVEHEIKGFFTAAEKMLCGQGEHISSIAMRSITNGCETVGDIRDRESDFFYKLQKQYGIILDEKESYYSEADYAYNIEIVPDEFPNDERSSEAVKFISHINKLRKGETFEEYTKSRFLLITETRRIQEMSNALCPGKCKCGFALPTSTITNILWFKLGSGFSKQEYPINTNVSYKARGILAGVISADVTRIYEETKKQYIEGTLDQDQVASRIVLLRDKNCTPDEVTSDNLDELLDFSPEYIEKFEEGIKQNQVQLQAKNDIIEKLAAAKSEGDEQNIQLKDKLAKTTEELGASQVKVEEQENTILKQNEELERLRNAEKKRSDRICWWKRLGYFFLRLLIYAIAFGLGILVISKLLEHLAPQVASDINLFVDAVGIIGYIFTAITGAWKKVYGKKNNSEVDTDSDKTGE